MKGAIQARARERQAIAIAQVQAAFQRDAYVAARHRGSDCR
jgi:hypothetical protein